MAWQLGAGCCCNPGGPFLARQIQAIVGWYGSFAFTGGFSTTLWLVETHTIAMLDLIALYGAGWGAVTQVTTTTINQWTGASTTVVTYGPGNAAQFTSRQSLESTFFSSGNTLASSNLINTPTEVKNQFYEIVPSSNPGTVHWTDDDAFTVPVTQADTLTNANSLIAPYLSSGLTALPFSDGSVDTMLALLVLTYDASGNQVATRTPFLFAFPSDPISELPIASQAPLASGASPGDAVTIEIGQILASDNFWDSFASYPGPGAPANCHYHCNPVGHPAVLYPQYGIPGSPGEIDIIADPFRNYASPCDGTPPPTC